MDNKVPSQQKSKHRDLDSERLKKAAPSPEELTEDEKNLRAWAATEKLIMSGIQIKDVFGKESQRCPRKAI
jgi:hypothetical protein